MFATLGRRFSAAAVVEAFNRHRERSRQGQADTSDPEASPDPAVTRGRHRAEHKNLEGREMSRATSGAVSRDDGRHWQKCRYRPAVPRGPRAKISFSGLA